MRMRHDLWIVQVVSLFTEMFRSPLHFRLSGILEQSPHMHIFAYTYTECRNDDLAFTCFPFEANGYRQLKSMD